jgi:hypothetical protein
MPEQEEPPKIDYFASAEPAKPSASRKAVGLGGFIAFGSVALLFCVQFVGAMIGGDIPLIILVGCVAAFLIWLAVQEFRNFLR